MDLDLGTLSSLEVEMVFNQLLELNFIVVC
jgi:hypothetical protein